MRGGHTDPVPVYEFRCPSCSTLYSELVGAEAPAPACPSCGGTRAERVLSSFTAGPARRSGERFTPAMTRRDAPGHGHHHH